MADYSALSLAELKEEAKKRGLKGISAMRKPELVEWLSNQETPVTEAMEESIAEEPVVKEPQEEPAVEDTANKEERRMAAQGMQERRPLQYQERGQAAYQAVNTALVQRNWLIGYRIAEAD